MSFALFLLLLLVVTGAVWALEMVWLGRRRREGAKQPWWVEYSVSFFPVILIVFVLRSFLVEPFKIPSGSMIPTLLVGDFILVNKFTYGIRLPVLNRKVVEIGAPRRGDVVVFRYPEDPSLDYIKRSSSQTPPVTTSSKNNISAKSIICPQPAGWPGRPPAESPRCRPASYASCRPSVSPAIFSCA